MDKNSKILNEVYKAVNLNTPRGLSKKEFHNALCQRLGEEGEKEKIDWVIYGALMIAQDTIYQLGMIDEID